MPISKPFDLLIFGLFGLTRPEDLKISKHVGDWTITLFKLVFLIYLFITVIVLINLLIAMMSDTYQRIQVQSIPLIVPAVGPLKIWHYSRFGTISDIFVNKDPLTYE